MADAITLDILIDPNGEARRVLDELKADFQLAGHSAEEAAKKVEKFEQGIKEQSAKQQAKERLRELAGAHDEAGDAAKRHATGNQQLAATIAQYVGPTLIVAATKKTLEYADAIAELAQKTGFSIEGIQRIGQVAKQSGSSFEQVAASMNQLQNRLETGNKKATDALKGLGIAQDEYMRMRPDEQFRAVAEAVAGIEDPAKRTKAAMDLMGRSGADLIPTFMGIKDGALESADVLSTDFVEAAAEANDEIDKLIDKGKNLMSVFLGWPLVWVKTLQDWRAALADWMAGMPDTLPAPPGRPDLSRGQAIQAPGDPFAPGAFGGNSLKFVEDELTQAVKENIKARKGNTATVERLTAVEQQRIDQNFAVSNRGVMAGALFGQNIPGIGPGSFPGFALPTSNLPSRALVDLANPATWNGSGAGMFRAPVASALEGGSAAAGGGNWLSRLMGGRFGGAISGGLGMLTGLIPGMSGRGSSFGGMAGGMLGSIVGGPLAPILGPIGGLVGGLFGKLFGGGEGKKVNDQRDQFTSLYGDINKLNEAAQKAGVTLDGFLGAKTQKQWEAASKTLKDALDTQEAREEFLKTAGGLDALRVRAQRAGVDIQAALDAKTPEAFRKELEKINKAFEDQQKRIAGLHTAAGGLQTGVGALDLAAERGDLNPEQMQRRVEQLGNTAQTVFLGILQETGNWQAALDAVGPSLDGLAAHYEKLGLKAEGTLAFLLEFRNTVKNNQDVAASVQSVAAQLDGLGKSGRLTQESFTDFGTTAVEDYNRLIDRGVAADQALALMQPTIQKLYEAQKDLGLEVDEGTKSLIEMGQRQGIVGEGFRSESDKMIKAMERIAASIEEVAKLLETRIPGAARTAANAVGDIPGPSSGNPGGDPNGPGGEAPVNVARGGIIQGRGRVLYFNRGGWVPWPDFQPIGTDTVPAMLTPGEMVVPRDTARELAPYMPTIIEGGIDDVVRDMAPTVSGKGGSGDYSYRESPLAGASGGQYRELPRLDPGAARTQPLPVPSDATVVPVFIDGGASDREIVEQVIRALPRRMQTGQLKIAIQKAAAMRRAS